ncbi:MAG: hypothetical protein JWN04_6915 [Myxococcaceae bacterium]|nr:hypothetical protein [Myxococcaceae bacterium]
MRSLWNELEDGLAIRAEALFIREHLPMVVQRDELSEQLLFAELHLGIISKLGCLPLERVWDHCSVAPIAGFSGSVGGSDSGVRGAGARRACRRDALVHAFFHALVPPGPVRRPRARSGRDCLEWTPTQVGSPSAKARNSCTTWTDG